MAMTEPEVELSKKLLHAQGRILELATEQNTLYIAITEILRRLRTAETLLDAVMLARGAGPGADRATRDVEKGRG